MQTRLLLSSIVLLSAVQACSPVASPEEKVFSDSSLNAVSKTLWPVKKGVATVPVCWLPAQIDASRFLLDRFVPEEGFIEERRAWVREIAESQWNASTPLEFVGWKACGANRARFVQLVPTDSYFVPPCGSAGQSCVEDFGARGRGKRVFLNLAFGDEFLYASRVLQERVTNPEHRSGAPRGA